MARVKGPLFSLSASGTYLKKLVFRTTSKGTHVATLPQNLPPRSPAQAAHSQKIAEMAASWKALSPSAHLQWASCAVSYGLTGYALYWREWIAQSSTPQTPPVSPCP